VNLKPARVEDGNYTTVLHCSSARTGFLLRVSALTFVTNVHRKKERNTIGRTVLEEKP